jgi:hypothetical protein
MSIEWHRDNLDGTIYSATVADGQEGWFDAEVEADAAGWRWVINHESAFQGEEGTLEQAKVAVATWLEQAGERFPICEIRPFTEVQSGGYLITFSEFPGVVAFGITELARKIWTSG